MFDDIEGDDTVWEQEPLIGLAGDGELAAYRHTGFWQPIDTLHDCQHLNALWKQGKAPWCVWRPRTHPRALPMVHRRTRAHPFLHDTSKAG